MTEKKKKVLKEILEWVIWLGAAVLCAFILNRFILLNSDIISGSMENTIMTGDRVIGLRTAYWFDEPERGDIIIFKHESSGEDRLLIKRVIGLPGDTVRCEGGKVYINDVLLEEDYLAEEMDNGYYGIFQVPEGCYFVMGDNRNNSIDSRYWTNHYVNFDDIQAKAWAVYYPSFRKLTKQ